MEELWAAAASVPSWKELTELRAGVVAIFARRRYVELVCDVEPIKGEEETTVSDRM